VAPPGSSTEAISRGAAFLRGVHVGGANVRMAEVKQAVEGSGFTSVKTILASGNLLFDHDGTGVFDHDGTASAARELLEETLRASFGYEAWALVYDLAALARIEAAFPFPKEVADMHSCGVLCSDPAVLDELAALELSPGERRGSVVLTGPEGHDARRSDGQRYGQGT
jgi:uncharacterized protein (DUF1697 family)